jgi:hypothetical protein
VALCRDTQHVVPKPNRMLPRFARRVPLAGKRAKNDDCNCCVGGRGQSLLKSETGDFATVLCLLFGLVAFLVGKTCEADSSGVGQRSVMN